MCTAIAFRGNDLLYGFNLDLDPAVWHYSIHKTPSLFAIGITVGKTTCFVHGINRNGQFGNVPYSNGTDFPIPHGVRRERIDLMSDRYIRGKYSFEDVETILAAKTVTNIPAAPMHSLIGNGKGEFLIIEPGNGFRRIPEHFAVLTNFPVLKLPEDLSDPFYGKDRYDKATAVLSAAPPDFSAEDTLRLLYDTRQTGQWATRVSFVWSRNQNTVFFFPDGDLSRVEEHRFS